MVMEAGQSALAIRDPPPIYAYEDLAPADPSPCPAPRLWGAHSPRPPQVDECCRRSSVRLAQPPATSHVAAGTSSRQHLAVEPGPRSPIGARGAAPLGCAAQSAGARGPNTAPQARAPTLHFKGRG